MDIKQSGSCCRVVDKRQYYVYRYEGCLNDLEDAVVLISYPKGAFGLANALRAFICTDCRLSTLGILDLYLERWAIEVFFRQAKQKLALDKYQIRSSRGIRRYWLLMSLAHFICCMGTGITQGIASGEHPFYSLWKLWKTCGNGQRAPAPPPRREEQRDDTKPRP